MQKAIIKLRHQAVTALYKTTVKVEAQTTIKDVLKLLSKRMDIDFDVTTIAEKSNDPNYQCEFSFMQHEVSIQPYRQDFSP